MAKECILEHRECNDCEECLKCDLDSQKNCDNCDRCIEPTSDYSGVYVEEILTLIETPKKD